MVSLVSMHGKLTTSVSRASRVSLSPRAQLFPAVVREDEMKDSLLLECRVSLPPARGSSSSELAPTNSARAKNGKGGGKHGKGHGKGSSSSQRVAAVNDGGGGGADGWMVVTDESMWEGVAVR